MRVSGILAEVRPRWELWPVWGFALGIALYLGLPREPAAAEWAASAVSAAIAAAVFLRVFRPGPRRAAVFVLVVLAGAGWAAAAAWRAAAPVLARPLAGAHVEGRVETVEPRSRGVRIRLADCRIAGLAPAETPNRIRLTLAGRAGAPVPGDRISLKAAIYPPSQPVYPGAYDAARHAWFSGLGATGYALSPWRKTGDSSPGILAELSARLQRLRAGMVRRIARGPVADPGERGIVLALMTGERGTIPPRVAETYRIAGLAHMLAISGLHMGLLAGLAFLVVRRGLALVPGVALRFPIKKWAAAAAMVLTLAYLLVSGASVPTRRAFVMSGLVLLAVMTERSPFSPRLVAIAALAVLLLDPEAVTGPSFQMSFAAVIALIAAAEAGWFDGRPGGLAVFRRPFAYLRGAALTTVIAGLATAPFALTHFGRVSTYSIVANLAAIPVLGAWVMPWGVAAGFALPFGGGDFALCRMAEGIGLINAVARHVAAWPGVQIRAPAMPVFGLFACAAGGLWLCLVLGRARLLGLILVAIGLSGPWWRRPPDLLATGTEMAVWNPAAGVYDYRGSRAGGFVASVWRERTARPLRADPGTACGSGFCRWETPPVAEVRTPWALAAACAAGGAAVARFPASRDGGNCALVLDDGWFAVHGATAAWITADGTLERLRTVAEVAGNRPWSGRAGRDQ